MIQKPKRLMVMAGGTAGHIFPGLVVSLYLIDRGWQVRWLGTEDRIEAKLVPKHGIDIDFIQIDSLRGKSLKLQFLSLRRIWKAIRHAKLIVRQFQPDVVLGMGGYVSGPSALAAWLCGIPVVLHEQNAVAGLTNRWLSRIATKALQAFPGSLPKAKLVGNPIRPDILALQSPSKRLKGRLGPIRILVIGGSQGSRVFNDVMPEIALRLGEGITLWHQVGIGSKEEVLGRYKKLGKIKHLVTEFIDDIAQAYAWADVVVCRSGALTVSEVASVGLAAIFVPFQHQDRQQYWNALPFEEAGAAKIIEQSEFNTDVVCELLVSWHRSILREMAEKAHKVAIPDATKQIAIELLRVAQ